MQTTILSGDRHSAQLSTAELNQIIDLDRYPLDQLDSPKGKALVAQCQHDLNTQAASALQNFIRPEAVKRLTVEAETLIPSSYRFVGKPRQTYPDADPAAELDPIAKSVRGMKHANSNNQVLNYQIPNNSDLRVMFLWPQLCEFVRRVRRVETLYPSQCPHLGLTMKAAFEGDNDGWHYDPNDGVVTLLLQSPDEGGEFEYAPNIRDKTDENYEGVRRLFENPDKVGLRVNQGPGTLTFFNGRNSMHRVRQVGETRKPRIVGIFSFDQRPDQIFGENYIRMIHELPKGAPT
jgi:hypothetical protein